MTPCTILFLFLGVYMKENEISIYKFLYTYLFITNKDLYKITHEDVKILFPYLKRCSFDDVKKNPHLIKDRKVVFVNDGRKTIPYYVPEIEDYFQEKNTIGMVKDEEYVERSYYDFENMSNYELKETLENKNNARKNRMKAKQELEERGLILKKKYKREKYRYEGE